MEISTSGSSVSKMATKVFGAAGVVRVAEAVVVVPGPGPLTGPVAAAVVVPGVVPATGDGGGGVGNGRDGGAGDVGSAPSSAAMKSTTGGVRLVTVRRRLRGRKPGAVAASSWSPSARLATSLFFTGCPSTFTDALAGVMLIHTGSVELPVNASARTM